MFYVWHTVNKRYARVERKKLAMITLTVLVILFPIKSELSRRQSSTYYIIPPPIPPINYYTCYFGTMRYLTIHGPRPPHCKYLQLKYKFHLRPFFATVSSFQNNIDVQKTQFIHIEQFQTAKITIEVQWGKKYLQSKPVLLALKIFAVHIHCNASVLFTSIVSNL